MVTNPKEAQLKFRKWSEYCSVTSRKRSNIVVVLCLVSSFFYLVVLCHLRLSCVTLLRFATLFFVTLRYLTLSFVDVIFLTFTLRLAMLRYVMLGFAPYFLLRYATLRYLLLMFCFKRDQLRLGVDECMDRFNPSVKHHIYEVHFIPVVRSDR